MHQPPCTTPPAGSVSPAQQPSMVEIVPGGSVHGSIRPPGSKSLTNRALICAAFATGTSTLRGALRSEDTEVMIDSLRQIGVQVDVGDGGRTLQVDPSAAQQSSKLAELFIANSGTSIRFLTAALSAWGGAYRLSGVQRMHERPIGDLVDALSEVIDGSITAQSADGCPPVTITGNGWASGDAAESRVVVAGNVSSQYLSGLMMACPISRCNGQFGNKPNTISVTGELVSRPYVEMTAEVMRSFGADVSLQQAGDEAVAVRVLGGGYQGCDYEIEPDASAASYFWAAAAISGGEITVEGLTAAAMQGDVGFVDVLQQMGCDVRRHDDSITVVGGSLRGIDVDMNAISDTVQTLAVVALFAQGPTRVRGVAHNRFKETDRIGDLACELRKLGASVDEHGDGMTITPPAAGAAGLTRATLETYHDHRMAMSLALAGLRIDGVRILDPACTGKTYPEFFYDLESLTGRSHRWM